MPAECYYSSCPWKLDSLFDSVGGVTVLDTAWSIAHKVKTQHSRGLTCGGLYSFELSAVKTTVTILSCYDLFAVNVLHIAVKALCALWSVWVNEIFSGGVGIWNAHFFNGYVVESKISPRHCYFDSVLTLFEINTIYCGRFIGRAVCTAESACIWAVYRKVVYLIRAFSAAVKLYFVVSAFADCNSLWPCAAWVWKTNWPRAWCGAVCLDIGRTAQSAVFGFVFKRLLCKNRKLSRACGEHCRT